MNLTVSVESLIKYRKNIANFFDHGTEEQKRRRWGVSVVAFTVVRLFSQGLANFFALETLRHGTNPFSWFSIHAVGALPKFGGSKFGGDAGCGFDKQNVNRFYCAYQVDLFNPAYSEENHLTANNSLLKKTYQSLRNGNRNIANRIGRTVLNAVCSSYLSKTYSVSSTLNLANDRNALLLSFITPNIKFHISKERLAKDFAEDPTYPKGFAYSTNKWISPINSGLAGIIWNSLTYKTPIRMFRNPVQVLTGVAQMAIASGTAALLYHVAPRALKEHRWAVIITTAVAVL